MSAVPTVDEREGTLLSRRYRLERRLGAGSLGCVYAATDTNGKPCAVKLLRRESVSDDAFSRLIADVGVATAAAGDVLVPIVDVGHDLEHDDPFVVMPLLAGTDLASVLAKLGPLPAPVAVAVALRLAQAVGAAHARKLVHRNLNVRNVFFEERDDDAIHVRVCDLGLAPPVPSISSAMPESAAAAAARIAPESALRTQAIDERTDVFALGAVLYEMLSGTPPWGSSSDEIVASIASGEVAPLQTRAPWVDGSIAAIVHRALMRDPAQRFRSANELAERLANLAPPTALTKASLRSLTPQERAHVAPKASLTPLALSDAPNADGTDPLVGQKLAGRYTVERLLGQGGMGAVYECRAETGERVAVKIISREIASDRQLVARFLREARSATRIQSPYVVRTLELGTDIALGVPFIVMELLDGQDLHTLFEQRGAIEPKPLVRVFLQAARGLAAAHQQSIVHRDIKPANVFLHAPDGAVTAKICDFGIAKGIEGASTTLSGSTTKLTNTGGLLGTPVYMSPEQARSAKHVDARTDVWSLCASLYEGLSGRGMWNECTSVGEVVVAICTKPVPPLTEVAPWIDPALAAVVHKGLRADPQERYASAAELAEALVPFVGGVEDVKLDELRTAAARVDAPRPPPQSIENLGTHREKLASAPTLPHAGNAAPAATLDGQAPAFAPEAKKTRSPLLLLVAACAIVGVLGAALYVRSPKAADVPSSAVVAPAVQPEPPPRATVTAPEPSIAPMPSAAPSQAPSVPAHAHATTPATKPATPRTTTTPPPARSASPNAQTPPTSTPALKPKDTW